MAGNSLHTHLKEKLVSVSHMLVLSQEELTKQHLNHGLILDVTTEKLIAGALEEAFIEFVSSYKYILVLLQLYFSFATLNALTLMTLRF